MWQADERLPVRRRKRVMRRWPKHRRCGRPSCPVVINGADLTQYWRRCYWHEIVAGADLEYGIRLFLEQMHQMEP